MSNNIFEQPAPKNYAKEIDWSKPIEFLNYTGDWVPARVMCLDAKGDRPILILYTWKDKELPFRTKTTTITKIRNKKNRIKHVLWEYKKVVNTTRFTSTIEYDTISVGDIVNGGTSYERSVRRITEYEYD